MEPDRWRRVDQLYHRVVERPPAERSTFLDEACAGESWLREEVESLLSFETSADTQLHAAVREVALQVPGLISAPMSAPAKMGRYELIEKIGKGGMGVVYRAKDPAIGRTVAIKTIAINEDREQGSELRARLLRESEAAGRLSHPNIVGIYDVGQDGETAYIVMEYVEGRTLSQFIEEKSAALSSSEIMRIIKDCSAALDYAHSHGVIHRDVKPSNVILQANGVVKVADFGIAKVAQSPALTQSSATIGSPEYMAPEQWRGQAATGQTDQYALAAVGYAMLAGRRPFVGDSVASLAALTLHEDPPPASTFNSRLSPGVDKVLRKALARSPAARYSSCSEFAAALEKALELEPSIVGVRSVKIRRATAAAFAFVAALLAVAWPLLHRTADNRKVVSAVTTQPPVNWEARGELQAKQNNYHEAVESFTQAIAAAPGYRPYFNRASAYQHLGASKKAIADYTQALIYKPDSALALHDRAQCEMRLNLVEDASRDYDEALKLQPDNPRTWNARGAIYLKQRRYQEALECFTKAIQFDPNLIQAYQNRAIAKRATGNSQAAEADLTQAKAIQDRNAHQ